MQSKINTNIFEVHFLTIKTELNCEKSLLKHVVLLITVGPHASDDLRDLAAEDPRRLDDSQEIGEARKRQRSVTRKIYVDVK